MKRPVKEPQRHNEIINRLKDREAPHWVEVGVYRGANARRVMKGAPRGTRLLAVDPWLSPLGTGNTFGANDVDMAKQPQGVFDRWYRETVKELSVFGSRVTILRLPSVEAAKTFYPDGVTTTHFDLVFIDGDHSYEACKADIIAWLPLVKGGGWIGGHDYGKERFPGVTQAVDEMANHHGITTVTGVDSVWFWGPIVGTPGS